MATFVLAGRGSTRDGAVAASRNTTKTDSYGPRLSGTVVRPSSMEKAPGPISPVSGCHSSADRPATRKRTLTSSARSFWLATK